MHRFIAAILVSRPAPVITPGPVIGVQAIPYRQIWADACTLAPFALLIALPAWAGLQATEVQVPTFTADTGIAGEQIMNNTAASANGFVKFLMGPIMLVIVAALFLGGVIAWGMGQRAVGVTLLSTFVIAAIGRMAMAWI